MPNSDVVILFANYGMGKGPEELQLMLIGKYLQLLGQGDDFPAVVCFYTEGVKLVIDGSPVLKQLAALEKIGVRLIICSTCVNYFGLADKVNIGIVGGMTDILEAILRAGKVITL
jgi:intracellular sulfur oxidation DsrE/DsrF family protein